MSHSARPQPRPQPQHRARSARPPPLGDGGSLPFAGSDHPVVRRYSAARRNQLPRDDLVVAVGGRWAHLELLRLGGRIEALLHCPGDQPEPLLDQLVRAGEVSYLVSARTAARLCPDAGPGALLSLVRLPTATASILRQPEADLVLVADAIEYAGNLGTLVRTADGCGAAALVLTGPSVRLTHPKVFVASRATVLTLPVLRYAEPAEARDDLDAAGWRCVVADPAGTGSYLDQDFRSGRTAVVVGSERTGVGPGWRTSDLDRVSIPMLGRADSLNVAVSAAMLLAEARRQRSRVSRPAPRDLR